MFSKADLHIHTRHSFDGLSEPEEIIQSSLAAGLSVISVTDHDKIEGALETYEAAKGSGLDVIIGEEIYTGEGELIGLYISEHIPSREGLNATIDEIHRQGGLVVVPHPFAWSTLKETITVRKMRKIYEKVDAIEIVNPTFFGRRGRKKAPRLNRIYGLAELGSSDSHHHASVGHSYTVFKGQTAEDLRGSILNRNTEAVFGGSHPHTELVFLLSENLKKLSKYGYHAAKKKIRRGQ